MEVNIEEDENELELTYPYEEMDPLNPLSPASEFKPDDEIEVENLIEHVTDIHKRQKQGKNRTKPSTQLERV
ncbi:hypothetical protein Tco_1115110 [Tanacetum coccineum]